MSDKSAQEKKTDWVDNIGMKTEQSYGCYKY